MRNHNTLTNLDELLLELYKCHYNAKEAAEITGLPYQAVAALFRGFKVGIKPYPRYTLSTYLQNLAKHASFSPIKLQFVR